MAPGRSRAGITAATIGLADREGLDALSVRRLATEPGSGAASFYRYVATREDLLDLMTLAGLQGVMLATGLPQQR